MVLFREATLNCSKSLEVVPQKPCHRSHIPPLCLLQFSLERLEWSFLLPLSFLQSEFPLSMYFFKHSSSSKKLTWQPTSFLLSEAGDHRLLTASKAHFSPFLTFLPNMNQPFFFMFCILIFFWFGFVLLKVWNDYNWNNNLGDCYQIFQVESGFSGQLTIDYVSHQKSHFTSLAMHEKSGFGLSAVRWCWKECCAIIPNNSCKVHCRTSIEY